MKHCKQVGLPVASILLVCLYPCAFLYFQNAGEARAVDMLPFFGIFLLTAAVIFLAADVILRNVARAAVLCDLAMLVVINLTMVCNGIKKLLPGFHNRIFLLLAAAVLLGLLVLLARKKPNMTAACGLIALMFGSMILLGGFTAAPTLLAEASYHRETVPLEELSNLTFSGEKRNVYYMIFDEYGGSENLLRYYDYDNEEFLTALEERGFSVSHSSRNTESPWTVTLVPNLVNLQYVTSDNVPVNNRLEWLEEPMLYQLFRANGYRINLVNQNGFLGETGCRVLTRDQREETISAYLYENSVFCQIPGLKGFLEKQVLHRGENADYRALEDAVQAMIGCWKAADGPTLTVCYVIAPHAPFLFDESGTPTDKEDYYERRRPELYLAKLYYINQAILEAVDNIRQHDPDAVILLQADHGSRLPGHLVEQYGGPWYDPEIEIPYMENVLNCVYVPGDGVDAEGESCINTARKTLSYVFGLNLEPLEQPADYQIAEEFLPPPPDGEQPPPGEHPDSGQEVPAGKPPHQGDKQPPADDPPENDHRRPGPPPEAQEDSEWMPPPKGGSRGAKSPPPDNYQTPSTSKEVFHG